MYNSGYQDFYVYLQDQHEADMTYIEEIYDTDRYVCWYDTAAYQEMHEAYVDLVRVEVLDPSYYTPLNYTYDVGHYVASNT